MKTLITTERIDFFKFVIATEVNEHNKSSGKIIISQELPKSLIHINIKINFSVPHFKKATYT